MEKMNGNNHLNRPDHVKWYGLCHRTPEELAQIAVTGIICEMTIEFHEGIRPVLEKVAH